MDATEAADRRGNGGRAKKGEEETKNKVSVKSDAFDRLLLARSIAPSRK